MMICWMNFSWQSFSSIMQNLINPNLLEQPVTGTYLRGHIFGNRIDKFLRRKFCPCIFVCLFVCLFYSAAVSMLSEIYKRFPRDMKKSNLFCASFSYNSSLGFFFIYLISRSKMQNSKYRTFSKDKYRIFCLVTTNFSNKDMFVKVYIGFSSKEKQKSITLFLAK